MALSRLLRPPRLKLASRRCLSTSRDNEEKDSNLIKASDLRSPSAELPSSAKIVICGGGAQGAAIAYKLALRGLGNETVLLDQGVLGGGTTWHSSGLISLMKPSFVETKLTKISKDLYLELQNDHGYYTGWKEVGSLYVAQTEERMHYYRRLKSESVARDVECELVTPTDCKTICNAIEVKDLKGGLWVPGDGVADPYEICLALSVLAAKMGVKIVQNCKLEDVVAQNGKVTAVKTNFGVIECENFVNTAGFWARHIGILSNPRIQVPMHPAEHYYLTSKPVPFLAPDCPVIRDPDSNIYIREKGGCVLAGGFEPVAKPAFEDGNLPTSSKSRQLKVYLQSGTLQLFEVIRCTEAKFIP